VFAYHNDEAKTLAAFRAPGTYTIGDIGSVAEDGYVYLADRASHMIISGGVNIYPAEIEQALIDHPAVADVGVFGIPDDGGAAVRRQSSWRPASASPDLEASCRPSSGAAGGLQGAALDRLRVELPRSPTGKLYVRRLKDPYWAGHGRVI
jgi:long-chain acyl-CoA synthetase